MEKMATINTKTGDITIDNFVHVPDINLLRLRRKEEITAEADALCDAQTDYPRGIEDKLLDIVDPAVDQPTKDARILEIKAYRVKLAYILAVRAEEIRIHEAIDLSLNPESETPNWPVVV